MSKKLLKLLLAAAIIMACQSAQALMLDDFESYQDAASLQAAWENVYAPAGTVPTFTLAANEGTDGSTALKYTIDPTASATGGHIFHWINDNITQYDTLKFSYKIASVADTTWTWQSYLFNDTDGIWGVCTIDNFTAKDGWNEIEVDLNSFASIKSTKYFMGYFYNIDPSETAEIYFDNLQIVPEPATLSLLAIGGMLFASKRKRN